MKPWSIVLILTSLFFAACGEDEETSDAETQYITSSVTCNGSTTNIGLTTSSITFGTGATIFTLGGGTTSPVAICTGSYILTSVTFGEDGNFTYSIPAAATQCLDTDSNSVPSCDAGGVQCSTTSTDPATVLSGTYTRTTSELVLTYTSSGESFCPTGQTEVVTAMTQNSQ